VTAYIITSRYSPRVIFDDGGRMAAGFKGDTGDCVARAIAIIAELPYEKVYEDLAYINARTPKSKRRRASTIGKLTASKGIYVKAKIFRDYITRLGFVWTPTMFIGSGCKVHLRKGELPMGRLIVAVSRHYTAMIDGVVHDTHDPSRGGTRCVYGYWRREV
jgi:hypothetical protein